MPLNSNSNMCACLFTAKSNIRAVFPSARIYFENLEGFLNPSMPFLLTPAVAATAAQIRFGKCILYKPTAAHNGRSAALPLRFL